MKKTAIAGLLVLGAALSGCGGSGHSSAHAENEEAACVGGYDGWWNSTPVSGDTTGLPEETVTVDTNTGKTVDAFNRSRNDAGKTTDVSDVGYQPVPDESWPADSVVVIDTTTGKVLETIAVDPGTQLCQ
ncbi:hypothetical protein [Arthrobacter sp. zg-Y844]|uniref:hypothetical protein n=1 Tax=Arthrobacter sp. zg-Y844 TaxID=2964612 RepID=UPI002106299A|nr:hypothetical protein [Arthrobacter sp. zg-Y844]MCQ1986999.1 hypothetical protein [Arthrobacter sp. zg-Y844]